MKKKIDPKLELTPLKIWLIIFCSQCVNVSLEGEVIASDAPLEKREKDLLSLMQDDDLRSAARHLFKRMSLIPASRLRVLFLMLSRMLACMLTITGLCIYRHYYWK